jgi:hypothetical protein
MAIPPSDQHVTYQLQYRKCGKASCSTCRNGQGHGPYWYAYWREGTRLRSGYVGKINPHVLMKPEPDTGDHCSQDATPSSDETTSKKKKSASPHYIDSPSITSIMA